MHHIIIFHGYVTRECVCTGSRNGGRERKGESLDTWGTKDRNDKRLLLRVGEKKILMQNWCVRLWGVAMYYSLSKIGWCYNFMVGVGGYGGGVVTLRSSW